MTEFNCFHFRGEIHAYWSKGCKYKFLDFFSSVVLNYFILFLNNYFFLHTYVIHLSYVQLLIFQSILVHFLIEPDLVNSVALLHCITLQRLLQHSFKVTTQKCSLPSAAEKKSVVDIVECVRMDPGDRGVHPPEAIIHFPPCFRFPPIFDKFSDSEENFQNFTFSRKFFRFSSAKISDDLFQLSTTNFEFPPIFPVSVHFTLFRENYYFPLL